MSPSFVVILFNFAVFSAAFLLHQTAADARHVSMADEDRVDHRALRYGHQSPLVLRQKDRRLFIDEHTKIRRQVARRASNMIRTVWSADLEREAFYMAHHCQKEPNLPALQLDTFKDIGYNAFWKFGDKGDDLAEVIPFAMKHWNNGSRLYSEAAGKCIGSSSSWSILRSCNEYKQLVWANSTHVGCSVAFCKEYYSSRSPPLKDVFSVVCTYGNGLDRYADELSPAYRTGNSCSQCPPGFLFCKLDMCISTINGCSGGTVVDCIEPDDTCLCDYVPHSCAVPQRSTLSRSWSVVLPLINCVTVSLLRSHDVLELSRTFLPVT